MTVPNSKHNDWNCDQIRWTTRGSQKIPKSNPKLRKMYFTLQVSGSSKGSIEFVEYAYCLLHNPGFWLIHYLGNEKMLVPIPRGNKVRDTNGYCG